jgi:Predicted oxidoreductases (related to aryl-alcohol dehydrogenases)
VFCREQGFARPVSAQNRYSLMRREAEEELLPTCERLGIGVLPYFPLASGLLTGKYSRGADRPEGTRLSGRDESSRTRPSIASKRSRSLRKRVA